MRSPWPWVTVLALVQVALATVAWSRPPVTYVFTPLVSVSAAVFDAQDFDLKSQIDARDMQKAYARMGSTISLDDLLRGVEGLDLAPSQRARIGRILGEAEADHAAVIEVQREILALEAELSRQVEALR